MTNKEKAELLLKLINQHKDECYLSGFCALIDIAGYEDSITIDEKEELFDFLYNEMIKKSSIVNIRGNGGYYWEPSNWDIREKILKEYINE